MLADIGQENAFAEVRRRCHRGSAAVTGRIGQPAGEERAGDQQQDGSRPCQVCRSEHPARQPAAACRQGRFEPRPDDPFETLVQRRHRHRVNRCQDPLEPREAAAALLAGGQVRRGRRLGGSVHLAVEMQDEIVFGQVCRHSLRRQRQTVPVPRASCGPPGRCCVSSRWFSGRATG